MERLIIKYREKQRQQQFICSELFLFVVKQGTPTDEELEKLGSDIATDWMTLGRRLDVKEPKFEEIDQTHKKLSKKGYYMLKYWKQSKGYAATYQALCEALQHCLVQRQDLVEQFCYIKGNYFPQYTMWVWWCSGFKCAGLRIKFHSL